MSQRFEADELAIVRDYMRQAKEVFQRQVRGAAVGHGAPRATRRAPATSRPEGTPGGK